MNPDNNNTTLLMPVKAAVKPTKGIYPYSLLAGLLNLWNKDGTTKG